MGTTYQGTGKDFTRRPRLLLHKVSVEDFGAGRVRADDTLTLSAAAAAKLKALAGVAADKRMQQLWGTISPGKKAAASGSDGPAVVF